MHKSMHPFGEWGIRLFLRLKVQLVSTRNTRSLVFIILTEYRCYLVIELSFKDRDTSAYKAVTVFEAKFSLLIRNLQI